jgi:hypothetical protein
VILEKAARLRTHLDMNVVLKMIVDERENIKITIKSSRLKGE